MSRGPGLDLLFLPFLASNLLSLSLPVACLNPGGPPQPLGSGTGLVGPPRPRVFRAQVPSRAMSSFPVAGPGRPVTSGGVRGCDLDLPGGPPLASSPPLTGTRPCASLALPAHGRRRRCSAGGGGAGASPGVLGERLGPGRLGRGGWGASHPLRTGEGAPTAMLRSSRGSFGIGSGLVFVLPSGARAWEAHRLVLGGARRADRRPLASLATS